MAERRPKKKKRADADASELTKEEYAVAKHMRFNMEVKKATMFGDQADYFMGSKAVDFLLDSKWAKGSSSTVQFTDRESVVGFLTRLLNHGLFSHVVMTKREKKVKDRKSDDKKKKDGGKTDEVPQKLAPAEGRKTSPEESKPPSSPKSRTEKDGKETRKVKKKVKIFLELHPDQFFSDSLDEAYCWIYDPISPKTFGLGALLVLGVVAVCLFPLWPENIREYSWYLSVAGAIFVGGILVLAILRYILYAVVWIGTFGKLDFWLLPNLTAECGFFESFVPAYDYTWKPTKNELVCHTDEVPKVVEPSADDEKPKTEAEQSEPSAVDMEEKAASLDPKESPDGQESEDSSNGSGKGEAEDWVKVKKREVNQANA